MRRALRALAAALLAGAATAARAQEVRILEQDDHGLVLGVSTPAPALAPHARQEGRVEAAIPGAARLEVDGAPRVPYARALVGVPAGSRAVLRLLRAPALRISDAPLAVTVVPRFGLTEADGWVEPSSPDLPDGPFPARAAEIAWTGYLRDLQVAEVRFHPVRSASKEGGVLYSPEIVARVDFVPDPGSRPARPAGAAAGSRSRRDHFLDLQRRAVLNADQVPAGGGRDAAVEAEAAPAPEGARAEVGSLSTPAPLKISVGSDGLYRIDPNALSAAGVDPNGVDPRDFRMEHRGTPIPVEVLGESDGSFDPNDRVVFYGRAATGPYTRTNVYWLHFDGSPVRSANRSGAFGAAAPTPASFATTVHFEQDVLYTQNPPAAAQDHWWAKLQSVGDPNSSNVTYTVNCPSVDPVAHTATVRVNLMGRTSFFANPDHHTRIFLNGVQIDDRTWDGQNPFTHVVSVSSSLLVSGNNSVRVLMVGDLGPIDQVYMNYIEVDYRRTYAASSNSLIADGEGSGDLRFSFTGFGTGDVLVYDATDPNGLVRIDVPAGQITGSGPFTVGFQDNLASDRLYAASTFAALRAPASATPDTPSSLRSPANGADYIAVVHPDLAAAVLPLLALRSSQGLRVLEARTDDIYDEFSGGIFDPTSIRAFLEYAYANYQPPAPEFVLFVGDGHVDYRDNLASGTKQYVPPLFVNLPNFGETPSDNEYVAVAGPDVLPEMIAGRLPARTAQEVTDIVNKVLAYETSPPVAALNAQSLLVADDEDAQFEATLGSFASLLPPTMAATTVYHSQIPDPLTVRTQIKNVLDAGALTTTYMGHGSATQWDDDCTWATSNVVPCFRNDQNALLPTGRPSFIAALNCINGYWVDLSQAGAGHINSSLAEQMVKKDTRGAIAMWAPAALGTISDYQSIGDWLFREIFLDRERVVGRAVVSALIEAVTQPFAPADMSNVQELTLFGDPATNLALDSDGDGLTDLAEEGAGLDPLDPDGDDDGVTDGAEAGFGADQDGDGLVNALDPDSDDDGVLDGTEKGVVSPPPGTDVGRGNFAPDADPNSTTDPLDADTDGGGAADGAEDRDFDGAVDPGETDPAAGHAADDLTCASALPEVTGLTIVPSGASDLALSWTGIAGTHPCALYRVYVSDQLKAPATFTPFRRLALTSAPGYTHAGALADGLNHQYLVLAFDPVTGEGPLGHYGR
jgi:hypothetical protein